ncbi:NAD(P)-dependent oxidoreductase [Xanthomonas phaseoli]|uniref:NAD(P)-dependent oxidoreductase n=1 Tax=Xanthomonas phaseoli TaxID=1985254 RepID=UPI001237C5A0|nr:NAD(P)-dependent oxidoreductase [Xanthomonas phaseoli]MBO9831250.1 NAD(P)-dependent oxidoreductase [Xanthomonas phaseoli pv. dieffenbachiae]MBO9837585.1 NAD(P)-dependent oxidoreductase [Xanthomonas phaseoli pv. dieffenbachiae]MBO9839175.1 NAD(P)-dependent oxidoreductase [Xanthomonas phaseoli pv. dieffenbachiae]MBO9861220.1 NAD(P)-dependent oxidoreductase [Xanthomonas phaseoli pv. dieffenbachiae]MBO9865096.1 NAD(P)-dependent oxidoreductase [Xanthomonas phaseoli pv. dieffenbachiae]
MDIGLVGMGNIGRHFAARWMAQGHRVIVHDTRAQAREEATQAGAIAAANLVDVLANAQVIALSLPLPTVVRDVAEAIAAAAGVRDPLLVVDLSTTGAQTTSEVGHLLDRAGVAFLSAPVSGGTAAAAQGLLTVMAAGPLAAYERARPVLDAVGRHIFYLGEDVRLGQTLKLINNTLYASAMLASCEALVCGAKAGLDARTMLDVINRSSGRCFATMERMQGALDRSFPVRFTTELLRKDVQLGLVAAGELGVPMHVSKAALQLLDQAVADGLGEADNIAAIQSIERQAGAVFGAAAA